MGLIMLNGESYSSGNTRDNTKVSKSGDTMSGQLKTSFNNSVAMGSYGASATTIPDLCNELRFSSGCTGSAVIYTAYTKDGVTIAANRWYNFIYFPHRSGGKDGAASGDNCNFGTIILSYMTGDDPPYVIRIKGSSDYVGHIYKLAASNDSIDSTKTDGPCLISNDRSISYVDGAKGNAGLYAKKNTGNRWYPAICLQTAGGGSWQIGNYNNEDLEFVRFTKENISSGTNTAAVNVHIDSTGKYTGTAQNAITWNGITDDHNTNNTSDTWVPVYTNNKLQHRVIPTTIAGTFDVSYTRSHASVGMEFKCWRFGNVVTIGGYFSCQATIAANTVLYSNFPGSKYIIYFTCKHEGNSGMYAFNMGTNGQLKTNQQIVAGNYLIAFTYVCA